MGYLEVHKELKPSTLVEYRRMLGLLYEEAQGGLFSPVRTQSQYEAMIKAVAYRFQWSKGTRYRMSIILDGYGKYAYREQRLERVPYENTFPKGGGKRIEFFSEEEYYQLAFNPFHTLADFVMTVLFWDCGMRRGELIALNVDDVDLDKRLIRVINNKTEKERQNPITEFAGAMLALYLCTLGFQGRLKRGYPLFYSSTWNRLAESTLAKHLKQMEGNVTFKVYAHKMRHSLGGRIVEAGGDLKFVQELLGHENLNTTAIYTHFEKHKKRIMYDRLFEDKTKVSKELVDIAV